MSLPASNGYPFEGILRTDSGSHIGHGFALLPSPAQSPPNSPQCTFKEPLNKLLVMKFGGTSLWGADALRRVADIVRERVDQRPVLVLSAMGKTTNALLAAAKRAEEEGEVDISKIREEHEGTLKDLGVAVPKDVTDLLEDLNRILTGVAMLREVSGRTRDMLVSFGERLSVRCFTAYYNSLNAKDGSGRVIGAKATDSWDLGMKTTSGAGSTTSTFSQVEVLASSYHSIAENLWSLQSDFTYIPVVTGYIAKDGKGIITTLGRDGSDLSATIIGASVLASEVQIWKDVSGILTIDPRVVSSAKPVALITFEEAAELCTFGANVVHPAAVLPACLAKVPMSVRNSTRPQDPGTRIVAELGPKDRSGKVVAMSSKEKITMIVIRSTRMLGQHGFLAHVFKLFNDYEASVDVIATSEVTVSLTLDQGFKAIDTDGLVKQLRSVANVEIKADMAMLTLITSKSDSTSVLRESFNAFEALGTEVEMVSHGASNVNVTFIVANRCLKACTQKLHQIFFEQVQDAAHEVVQQ